MHPERVGSDPLTHVPGYGSPALGADSIVWRSHKEAPLMFVLSEALARVLGAAGFL